MTHDAKSSRRTAGAEAAMNFHKKPLPVFQKKNKKAEEGASNMDEIQPVVDN